MADLKVLSDTDVKILQDVIANAKRGRLNYLPAPQPDLDLSSTSPETYIAFGSIPGLSEGVGTVAAIPGSAECNIYQVINEELVAVEGLTKTVLNLQESAISGYFPIQRTKFGPWIALVGSCCFMICCDLKVGGSDSVQACECSANVPIYREDPGGPVGNNWVLGGGGTGFDLVNSQSAEYYASLFSPPTGYGQMLGLEEPAPVVRWRLESRQQPKDLTHVATDPIDTLITSPNPTGGASVHYRGVQLYDHDTLPTYDEVGGFPQFNAYLSTDSQGIGPGGTFLYYTKTDDARLIIYPHSSDYITPSPNQAFYDTFNVFELEVRVDIEESISLNVPPASRPVSWIDYPEIEYTEDFYKEFNGGGWLGFLQPECLRLPYEYTGTGSSSTEVVEIGATSPIGERSKARLTVVVGGELYTCEYYAGWDDESQEDVLIQSPIAQAQLMMHKAGRVTTDQQIRRPLLQYGAQYQGFTPATIPQSRWIPVRAWTEGLSGTDFSTGTGGGNVWVLPNGFDWRKTCLRIDNVEGPVLGFFDDYWIAQADNDNCAAFGIDMEYCDIFDLSVSVTFAGLPTALEAFNTSFSVPLVGPGNPLNAACQTAVQSGDSVALVPATHQLSIPHQLICVFLHDNFLCTNLAGLIWQFSNDDAEPGECASLFSGDATGGSYSFSEDGTPPHATHTLEFDFGPGNPCNCTVTAQITISIA